MTSNTTLKYRVGQLEKAIEKTADKEDVTEMKKDLKLVLTNHLPHIQSAMSAIKTEVRILAVINIGALILVKFLL